MFSIHSKVDMGDPEHLLSIMLNVGQKHSIMLKFRQKKLSIISNACKMLLIRLKTKSFKCLPKGVKTHHLSNCGRFV